MKKNIPYAIINLAELIKKEDEKRSFLFSYYIMFEKDCQLYIFDNKKFVRDNFTGELKEVLQDFSSSGRENPHSYNKRLTNYLSDVYKHFNLPDEEKKLSNGRKTSDYKKIPFKLGMCSNYLEFIHLKNKESHISYIESCHCSLCPTCNFFRSRNNLRDFIMILEDFFSYSDNCKLPFVFLTLTVPNCPGSDLRTTVKKLSKAFNKFLGYDEIKNIIVGCSRSLEITVNEDTGDFHPHFHCLLVLREDYFKWHRDFKDNIYLDKLHWLFYWQRALGLHRYKAVRKNQYTERDLYTARRKAFRSWCEWFGSFFSGGEPFSGVLLPSAPKDLVTSIDIKRVLKWDINRVDQNARRCIKLLGEVVKYPFKPDEILTGEISIDVSRIYWLDGALYHTRRWNLSGVLRDIQKRLNLPDPEEESSDLVQICGVDIEQIEYISGWWFSSEFGEYIKGKCKTIEQKNKARRALGLPLLPDTLKVR